MRRVHAAIAIFAGWASIPLGAVAGFAASQFLGLNVVEGPMPPANVYGISAAVVLLVFVAAALFTAIPLTTAVFAVSARRSVYATASVMAVIGVALLPDELGRAFGFPILVGAAAIAYGGRLLLLEAAANGANAAAGTAAGRSGPTPTWIFDTIELAGDETSDPMAGPVAALDSATSDQLEPAIAYSPVSAPAGARSEFPVLVPAVPGRRKPTRKEVSKTVAEMSCEWCSALVPAGATSCPTCKVPLGASDTQSVTIPGVTAISPELLAYAARARSGKKRPSLLKTMFSDTPVPQAIDAPPPSDAAALRPPSRELRAEMARLDADIAAGHVDPGGEHAADAAAQPPEAPPEATPEAPPEAPPEPRT
ncbi:MAG TPA: hypothetical protein VF371_09435 [Candidatus Limnocylindrales bacterium]